MTSSLFSLTFHIKVPRAFTSKSLRPLDEALVDSTQTKPKQDVPKRVAQNNKTNPNELSERPNRVKHDRRRRMSERDGDTLRPMVYSEGFQVTKC
eukprot:2399409-Amphidinium_carterae.1